MNARITDLHNQAIIFSGKNGGLRISSHIPNDYIEKFAELIVMECANIATEQFRARLQMLYARDCWTAAEIKEHFGVEE